MRNVAHVKSVNSKSVNPNDVEGAVLALVAQSITQPEIEDDEEYADMVDRIMEEYCPLFRVPEEIHTPKESKAAEAMHLSILSGATRMQEELLSSSDPSILALAVPLRTTAE